MIRITINALFRIRIEIYDQIVKICYFQFNLFLWNSCAANRNLWSKFMLIVWTVRLWKRVTSKRLCHYYSNEVLDFDLKTVIDKSICKFPLMITSFNIKKTLTWRQMPDSNFQYFELLEIRLIWNVMKSLKNRFEQVKIRVLQFLKKGQSFQTIT